MNCPVCAHTDPLPLVSLGEAPVFCNVQWPSRRDALQAAKGEIELAACRRCGHVFNTAFDPTLVAYAPGYENSQHSSSVFSGYAEGLVERLVSTYGFAGQSIVDIGCGRGDLLKMLVRRAGGRGFGFDPSYPNAAQASREQDLDIVAEHFGAEQARRIGPALICCRHVLEHIDRPIEFLHSLRAAAMAGGGRSIFYFEVPNGTHLYRTAGVWDVLYEHVSYFCAASLRVALEKSGFRVLNLYADFGDQFLCVDAIPADEKAPEEGVWAGPPPEAGLRMQERIEHWRGWISEALQSGTMAAIWGGGSKGVMFLNLLEAGPDGPIGLVFDQNPAKNGLFVSCTGQQIRLPSKELLSGVTQVIVMNSIYGDEIRANLNAMHAEVEVLFADA